MHKINYPILVKEVLQFEQEYYDSISLKNLLQINVHLSKIPYSSVLTFEKLLKLKFEDLVVLEPAISSYSKGFDVFTIVKKRSVRSNSFENLFDYTSNQKKIALFFMTHRALNLKTCSYCGMDYINAFVNIQDYFDGLDFINRANRYELQIVDGIGDKTADKLIAKRKLKLFTKINDIGLTKKIRDQINILDFKNGDNHFTLDHFLPQKTHKFYSVCLYNLVPSCYSCNSKYKKDLAFSLDNKLKLICPTSKDYSFQDDFRFKLFFSMKMKDIKSESDFIIQKKILRNKNHIEKYLATFKIDSRYIFHKDLVLALILKKIKYPTSKIISMSRTTGFSQNELKRQIFGEELFDNKFTSQPMVKLKRDIAKKLKIHGVL